MSKKRNVMFFLNDILIAIDKIKRYTKNMTFDEILYDEKTIFNVFFSKDRVSK